jgi:hypothetical protein
MSATCQQRLTACVVDWIESAPGHHRLDRQIRVVRGVVDDGSDSTF